MSIIENVLMNDAASQSSAKLYLNADLADVNFLFEIEAEIHKVPANKAILAVLSPVFHAMFFGSHKEKSDVKIVDATIETFKEFLQFFYLNKLTLTMENIEDIVRLADKYDILDSIHACATSLINKLTLDNMCWGYQLSIMLGNEELQQFCEKVIRGYSKDIFETEAFLHCDEIVLKYMLQLDALACNEFSVLDACLAWAKFSCRRNNIDETIAENLRAQLNHCFGLIRFGAMKAEEFATHTVSYRDMFTPEELADIFYTTTVTGFKSNKFMQIPRENPIFKWNSTQALVCLQENITSDSYSWINDNSIFFSTNYPVLLGEMSFHRLLDKNGAATPVHFNIKITEFSSHSFDACSTKKVLYKGELKYADSKDSYILFARPLLINPHKMYGIDWEVTYNNNGWCYYYDACNPEVKVDDSLIVKFYSRPASPRTCLVSRLCFNRL